MNKGKGKLVLISLCALCIVIVIVLIITLTGGEQYKSTIRIGFIMSGAMDEDGWNGMHYDGIKAASEELDVELLVKENVAENEGQCIKAIKELANKDANVIILSSYNYSKEVKELVRKYQDIAFYCNSSEYHSKNMTSYFVRYYQARYLAGVLAGLQTKSDNIGYVAAMANNEVNRGINAFTLGVKSVNKDADVVVAWTGSWDDEDKEKKLANALIKKEEVDVITYHQNKSYVIEVADEKEVYSIGYHEVFKGFSDAYLTSVVCNWRLVYKEMIHECLQGRANSLDNFWIGMEKNTVELSEYSDKVADKTADKIEKAKNRIINGKDVFTDEIYDIEGTKRCGKGETISDDILLEHMDWYVEGVKIYEE